MDAGPREGRRDPGRGRKEPRQGRRRPRQGWMQDREGRRGPRQGRMQDPGRGGRGLKRGGGPRQERRRPRQGRRGPRQELDAGPRQGRLQDPGRGGGDSKEEGTQAGEEGEGDTDPRWWEDLPSLQRERGCPKRARGWYTVRSSLGEMERFLAHLGWLFPKSFFWENHQWFLQNKPPR